MSCSEFEEHAGSRERRPGESIYLTRLSISLKVHPWRRGDSIVCNVTTAHGQAIEYLACCCRSSVRSLMMKGGALTGMAACVASAWMGETFSAATAAPPLCIPSALA